MSDLDQDGFNAEIARSLEVTAEGLEAIWQAVSSDRTGLDCTFTTWAALRRRGLADGNGRVTRAGRELVERARTLGWVS